MQRATILILYISLIFSFCGNEDKKIENEGTSVIAAKSDKQLNINVLWDLSDRIDSTRNPNKPTQYEKDLTIISSIAEIFKKDMDKKGAYRAQGKFKVFFTPPPSDNQINSIADNLTIDLSIYKGETATKEKKKIYDTLTTTIYNNAKQIALLTMRNNKNNKEWDGSNIWKFFKTDIDKVIEPDSNYLNILVILTDGYLYHKNSRDKEINRYAYLTTTLLSQNGLRNNPQWKDKIIKNDFGLIPTQSNLNNLNVLILEINSSEQGKNDEDVIQFVLEKWLDEMKVAKKKVFPTDLPTYTHKRIEDYFAQVLKN